MVTGRTSKSCFISLAMVLLSVPAPALAEQPTKVAWADTEAREIARSLHSMPNLILSLFASINQLGKYPLPTEFPRVHQVPHEEIERQACGGKCAAVKAAYVPEEGLYLDNNLDPEQSVMDRSILLHELVHHLQAVSGRYADLPPCERRQREEMEAFAIQNAYLASMRVGSPIPFPRYVYACNE